MNKILTIAIPTYNGSNVISDAIESVISNIGEYEDYIEILIVDNGSIDKTNEIVMNYIKQYEHLIRYFRNDVNIGYDKNIDRLFDLANGQYVKILADDDCLMKSSIKKLFTLFEQFPEVSLFQSNFIIYDFSMKNILNTIVMNKNKNIYCKNIQQFLDTCYGRYGQVSTLVIKRNDWLKYDRIPGIGTNYIHVYMTLNLVVDYPSYVISEPLVQVREGSPNFETNVSNIILVPLGVIKILNYFIDNGVHKISLKKLLFKQQVYILKKIIQGKVLGMENFKFIFQEIYKFNKHSIFFWCIMLPILLVPAIVYKTIFSFKRW